MRKISSSYVKYFYHRNLSLPFSGDPYITIVKGVKYKDLLINQCVMLQIFRRMFKPPPMGRIHTTTILDKYGKFIFLKK